MEKFVATLEALVTLIKGTQEKQKKELRLATLFGKKQESETETSKLEADLREALDILIFEKDFEKVSDIIENNLDKLLDGNGNIYYPPNTIASIITSESIAENLITFLTEPDINFDKIAGRLISESGEREFHDALIRKLLHCSVAISIYSFESIEKYLSENDLANVIIDGYFTTDDDEKDEIRLFFDFGGEDAKIIQGKLFQLASKTDRIEMAKKILNG